MEKTGTSSIQKTLATNKRLLRKSKVAYLSSPGKYNHRAFSLICQVNPLHERYAKNLGLQVEGDLQTYKTQFLAKFNHELAMLKSWVKKVVISSEHLQSRLLTLEEVEQFKNVVAPHFEKITIVMYLRRQDRQFVSLDSTRTRMSRVRASVLPKTLNSRQLAYYDYLSLIDRWSQAFGEKNIVIREYDSVVQNSVGGLIGDFVDLCGIDNAENLRISRSENLALNYRQRDACEWIQNHLGSKSEQFRLSFKRFIIEMFNDKNLRPKLPSKKEALRFYSMFADKNLKVARRLNDGIPIFSNDFSFYEPNLQQGDDDTNKKIYAQEMQNLVAVYEKRLRNPFYLLSSHNLYFYYLNLPVSLKNRIYRLVR
jgi:hypothetical protein